MIEFISKFRIEHPDTVEVLKSSCAPFIGIIFSIGIVLFAELSLSSTLFTLLILMGLATGLTVLGYSVYRKESRFNVKRTLKLTGMKETVLFK